MAHLKELLLIARQSRLIEARDDQPPSRTRTGDDDGCVAMDRDERRPYPTTPTDDPASSVLGEDYYPLDDAELYSVLVLQDPVYYDGAEDAAAAGYPVPGDDDALLQLELYGGGGDGDDDDDEEGSPEDIRHTILAGRLHVPRVFDGARPSTVTVSNNRDGGFGGVPASAAAIRGLKRRRCDDDDDNGAEEGPDDGSMCVICMTDYRKGKRLAVMPCQFEHRFHDRCLTKWLSRSHLCPLCRHALPTEDGQRDSC